MFSGIRYRLRAAILSFVYIEELNGKKVKVNPIDKMRNSLIKVC